MFVQKSPDFPGGASVGLLVELGREGFPKSEPVSVFRVSVGPSDEDGIESVKLDEKSNIWSGKCSGEISGANMRCEILGVIGLSWK